MPTMNIPRADGSSVTVEIELEPWARDAYAVERTIELLQAATASGMLDADWASAADAPLQGLLNLMRA